MARTALVTGGSGFLGGHLIDRRPRRLNRPGARAFGTGRPDRHRPGAQACLGDRDSIDSLKAAADGAEVVFHAAAFVAESGSRSAFVTTNVVGTANVLAAARDTGVRRVVHVSTEAVLMGGHPLVHADETWPTQ